MTAATDLLNTFSNALADTVASVAPWVVQVNGVGRPVSGVVYAPEVVVTTVDAIGREGDLRVRDGDGTSIAAELAGWDPTTGLAALRVGGLKAGTMVGSTSAPRVGHIAMAVGRSWSNVLSASAGVISVIGGPLPRGRRRTIDRVIRTTAPMHDGFSGGACVDTTGGLVGVATSIIIRGTHVVVPADIVRSTVAMILEHGRVKRGYLGIAGQSVRLGDDTALLIVAVTPGSPAAEASLLIGDILLRIGDHAIASPEDLLDILSRTPAGHRIRLNVLRGGSPLDVDVTVGERPPA